MPNNIVNGEIQLRADDGNWYWVRIYVEGTFRFLDMDQSPSTAPAPGTLEYAVLAATDGNNYKLGLVVDGGTVTYSVDSTPTGETPIALVLKGNDNNNYNVELYEDSGFILVNVTPGVSIGTFVPPSEFEATLILDDDSLCVSFKKLMRFSVLLYRFMKWFHYAPTSNELSNAFKAKVCQTECADVPGVVPVFHVRVNPLPEEFEAVIIERTDSLCVSFKKLIKFSVLLYRYMKWMYFSPESTSEFSGNFKAMLCDVDCPAEITTEV